MARLPFERAKRINLKTSTDYDESWVQDRIAEDPSILGLGAGTVWAKERRQVAGRLDFLLQDSEAAERYVVEIQLGACDPSHIVRTIEYWDHEERRYQDISHTAVLVAEDITSRYLGVIARVNGQIPFMALQMTAFELGGKVTLEFTKVLDPHASAFAEDEQEDEPVDRSYWETQKASPETVAMSDQLLDIVSTIEEGFELNFRKRYVGLKRDGVARNFVLFQPQRHRLVLLLKSPESDEVERLTDQAGIDNMGYKPSRNHYRIRLNEDDIAKHRDVLEALLRIAHDHYNS